MMVAFPKELHSYGLNENTLLVVFDQVQTGDIPLQWQLKGVPNADFYIKLHPFIKKWSVTKNATKVAVGKFYIAGTLQKNKVVLIMYIDLLRNLHYLTIP